MSGVLVLDHANVLTPQGVIDGHVLIDGSRITAVEPGLLPAPPEGAEVIDLDGAWLSPGFIDLQINGAFGIDVTTEPHRIGELGAGLVRSGVTSFLPTVITAPAERRSAALDAWRSHASSPGAVPLGLHLEGPMLSPVRRGAHPVEHLARPSLQLIEGWSADAGVALVTLAPELPGALEVIAALRERGVVVSIGHTDASAAEFQAGRAAGATYVTHLFNAMRPFAHRDPGPIGAALADPWAVTGLIADGVHVDPVAVAMAFRSRGPDRLTLVTDAVAAMPLGSREQNGPQGGRSAPENGERLGGVEVAVADGEVRTAGGVLAGSVCPLDQAVRNLIAWAECGVPSAVRTVTATPARLLGRKDLGAIEPGARADFVVLDPEARVRTTIVGGEVVWRS
jgi:N-acetylglucosamine-6-phosphate deacetylase